jgi:hypothetical protein
MSRASAVRKPAAVDHQAPVYRDDLQPAMQEALALLADLDFRFRQQREQIAQWNAPESVKDGMLEQLERDHSRAREPYVQLLGELHQRMMAALGYSHIH